MQQHLDECAACGEHDTRVRRSLLLVRNLPPMEPSPEFRARLRSSIRAAVFLPEPAARGGVLSVRLAAAAMLVFTLGYAGRHLAGGMDRTPLALPPVVATMPESRQESLDSHVLTSPAVVASYSAGLALWPAALVADQATDYFVNTAFTQASLTR